MTGSANPIIDGADRHFNCNSPDGPVTSRICLNVWPYQFAMDGESKSRTASIDRLSSLGATSLLYITLDIAAGQMKDSLLVQCLTHLASCWNRSRSCLVSYFTTTTQKLQKIDMAAPDGIRKSLMNKPNGWYLFCAKHQCGSMFCKVDWFTDASMTSPLRLF